MSHESELAHLFRVMKMPAAARSLAKLADRARQEDWSYERFLQALLSTETASRDVPAPLKATIALRSTP